MPNPVLPLFTAQSGNASSPTIYPAYGQHVLAQIDLNSVTTATVTIEGRIDSSCAWTVLFTVTEATAQASRAGLVTRLPEMKAVLANRERRHARRCDRSERPDGASRKQP